MRGGFLAGGALGGALGGAAGAYLAAPAGDAEEEELEEGFAGPTARERGKNAFFENFANFWRARSQLYQNKILQENISLTAFFKL